MRKAAIAASDVGIIGHGRRDKPPEKMP